MGDAGDAARAIFINRENELRSGWRVAAFFIAFLICFALLTSMMMIAGILAPSGGQTPGDPAPSQATNSSALFSSALFQIINLVSAIAATAICARLLERRSLASTGFKLHKGWARDFSYGSLLGAAALAFAIALAYAAGGVSFDLRSNAATSVIGGLLFLFFFFLIAAAFEEVLFRGFPFQALIHNIGSGAAIAITSILFGLAHLSTPNATIFSTVNVTLAGAWLGIAYLMTRSLWLATGLHYSWNFATVFIFGLPVSGWTTFDEMAWLEGRASNPVWLSGGEYGPEGGVAATLALIITTLVIWKSGLFAPTEEMLAAIKHGRDESERLSLDLNDRTETRS